MKKISATAMGLALCAAGLHGSLPAPAQAQDAPDTASGDQVIAVDARTWPRSYKVDDLQFAIFQPQLDRWEGNRLEARVVMAVETGAEGKAERRYGVLWLSARTETDKAAREVILDRLVVERASFPNAEDMEGRYLAAARKALPTTALVASLDAIEASLAIADADTEIDNVPVDNTPPEIIVSLEPAILVPIGGRPIWQNSGVQGVDRVLNTEAMILRHAGVYYAGRSGKWARAASLEGPWQRAEAVPEPVTAAAKRLSEAAPQAEEGEPSLPPFASFPKVLIRTKPAELIVVDGEPQFEAIEGTGLRFVANTPADLFVESDGRWYALVSGRWFTAPSTKGPWAYLASDELPADFQRIASDGPKGAVLASIAGTPEARELLIANSVPQTATIKRREASFTASYDGPAKFEPIEGTALAAARNSPTPIIRTASQRYYALEKGVWFEASTPDGPWQVASLIPADIYAIPSSSSLHFVTYVRVYGSSADEVYIGYTPGYYGSVVSSGVVVYGTGYACTPWIGSYYYGCPGTYGYGAAFAFSAAVGWGLMFGYGWYDPWYYPGWGPWYYPGYYPGYWGATGSRWNVYGRWGTSVVSGTRAAWVNSWTGNYGQGFRGGYSNSATGARAYGYAGRNTNIYTGNTAAAAGGVGYDPETGRLVAGRGASAGNIYTGEGVAAGRAGMVDSDTGRLSTVAGGAVRNEGGSTVVGGGQTYGPGGNAAGAGYIHYDRGDNSLSAAGVASVNGNIYAGKDGNVYRYDGEGWNNVSRPSDSSADRTYGPADTSGLDRERAARDRAIERERYAGRGFEPQGMNRPAFDRRSFGPQFQGSVGGFRGRMGR